MEMLIWISYTAVKEISLIFCYDQSVNRVHFDEDQSHGNLFLISHKDPNSCPLNIIILKVLKCTARFSAVRRILNTGV